MPALVRFNPLDTLLYAADERRRAAGEPGGDIHLYLECEGEVDVAGLRDALRGLWRIYPVTAARLHRALVTGRPAWRLPESPEQSPPMDHALTVLPIAGGADVHTMKEKLLAGRVDWTRSPPLQIYVLRGASRGDTVVMRWPHFLMDARGGATLLEELAALYASRGRHAAARSRGDERRRDFGSLRPAGLREALRALRQPDVSESVAPEWRLCDAAGDDVGRRLRLRVLRFSPDEAAEIRANALRVCGFARLADYLRAAGIVALHRTIAPSRDENGGYTTLHLVDNRRRRDPGPVCHNVFSVIPVRIPADQAGDIRAVADRIRDVTAGALQSRRMEVRLTQMRWLARLPIGWLIRIRTPGRSARRAAPPVGLSQPPSLPLGFMGPLSRETESFCGARLRNLFGVQAPAVASGYAVNVNAAQNRMNVAATAYEPRVAVERIESFLEHYRRALLDVRDAG